RVAAGLGGGPPDDVEEWHGVNLGADRREEAVAQPAGALGRRLRMPADHDRHRTAHRLGVGADLVELHELAVEADAVLGPQLAHHRDVLVRSRAALRERDAERLELLLEPADADAELDAAAA